MRAQIGACPRVKDRELTAPHRKAFAPKLPRTRPSRDVWVGPYTKRGPYPNPRAVVPGQEEALEPGIRDLRRWQHSSLRARAQLCICGGV